MRVIFALVARISAISLIGIGAANAQQQTRLQQFMQQLTPQQRERLKQQATPQQLQELERRLQRLTPQQQQEVALRLQLGERYRGWSMPADAFNAFDHCMRTTGKWTYRC
jgi:cell shape-determining protein MreC